MKLFLCYFIVIGSLSSCKQATVSNEENSRDLIQTDIFENTSSISFSELEWDFGDIKAGEKVEHLFTFVNDGENDLVVIKAVGSCGCTVPVYPEEAIKPGGRNAIKVVFDTKGKSGKQIKTVSVYANTEPVLTELLIKANIH